MKRQLEGGEARQNTVRPVYNGPPASSYRPAALWVPSTQDFLPKPRNMEPRRRRLRGYDDGYSGNRWLLLAVLGLSTLCCPGAQSTTWSSKDISSGPARGEYPVVVSGGGFDRSNRAFLCVFHAQNFSFVGLTTFSDALLAQSSEADVANNNTLSCIVPLWDYSAGAYSFSIFLNGVGLISFSNGQTAQRSFTFAEAWLSENEDSPTAGAAVGGSQLSFLGYGFNMGSSLYSCVFVRSGQTLSAPAHATSAKQLTCGTPAWGQQYFGVSDDRRQTFGIYSNVTIYLTNGGAEVKWLGESTGRDFGSSCVGRECAEFLFFSVWSGLFLNETASEYGVSIGGGDLFIVTGAAFSSSATYYCELRSVSSGAVAYTTTQSPLSPTSINFLTPSWQDVAGEIAVSLFLSNVAGATDPLNDARVPFTHTYSANITYDEAWTHVQPSSGLSQGGTQLFVAIEGLRSNAENRSYACRFDTGRRVQNCSVWNATSERGSLCVDGGIFLVADAAVLNATTLTCTTPEWVLAAASVPFTLLRRFSAEDPWHSVVTFAQALAPRFAFLEEWHGISGVASTRLSLGAQGGELFEVEGHGFDDSGSAAYACIFHNLNDTSQQMSSAGTVLGPSRLQCVFPAWGSLYGEGTVQLRIQQEGVPVPLTSIGNLTPTSSATCATSRCTLHVYAVWGSRAPSSGCATGGGAVLVRGAGFASLSDNGTTAYSCVFTAGAVQVSLPAMAVNSTAVSCSTQPWPSSVLTPHFTLVNAVALNPLNLTVEFSFVACWLSKSASVGRARGGELLLVGGAGFDDAAGAYACMFSTWRGSSARSPAFFVTALELACAVPAWFSGATDTNFSLVSGNFSETVVYDGPDADNAALRFRFTAQWTAIAPTVGAASGNTTIVVQGFGFTPDDVLACTFSRPGATSLTTAAVWQSNTEVSCPAPVWGSVNAAGPSAGAATFSLFQAGERVDFTSEGLVAVDEVLCAQGVVAGNCSFLFNPVFDSRATQPLVHAAGGGSVVTFAGLGFDATESYVCFFEYGLMYSVNASVSVFGTTQASCVIPAWIFRATSNVTLSILLAGSPLIEQGDRTDTATLTLTSGHTSISPTSGTAKGGDRLTVTGFGFDSAKDPKCLFNGVQTLTGVVISSTEIRCTTPTWYLDARITEFSLMLGMDNITAVQPNVTSSGTLFPERDPLPFEFYPEWTRHFPGIADRLGGSNGGLSPSITVAGFGFDMSQKYKCRLEMFDTELELRSSESAEVFASQPTIVVFEPPEWDLVTSSFEYVASLTNLSVFELADNGDWRLVHTLNGTSGTPVRVEQINKIPSFNLLSRNPSVPAQSTPYSFAIAENIYEGVTSLGLPVASELDQQLTFHLSQMSAAMFSDGPTLDADGILSFTVAENQFGTLHLYVSLQDNGGTVLGGVDRSDPALLHLTVTPSQNIPTFSLSLSSLKVLENSATVVVPGLVLDVSAGSNIASLQTSTFSVISDAYFFLQGPTVGTNGDLQFTVEDYAFGTTTLQIVLTSAGLNGSGTLSYTQDLEMEITQVNQPPSFTINASYLEVVVNEDQQGAASAVVIPGFALDVRAGPIVSDGAGGEVWDESNQLLSFVVIGGSPVFADGPAVDTSGTLRFTLAESGNGVAAFSLILRDDGDNFDGGRDTSSAQSFTIRVLAINDQPFFILGCPVEDWRLTCEGSCDGSDMESCQASVEVLENCADCEPRDLGYQNCSTSFVSYYFATNIRASALNEQNERSQSLSFVFVNLTNSAFLFSDTSASGLMPAIDTGTGLLSFCLAQGQSGNVSFAVSLVDDGGVAMGGLNTFGPMLFNLLVLPINQQPSFQLCCGSELHVWLNSGITERTRFLTHILKGDHDEQGIDLEATDSGLHVAQTVTFVVLNSLPSAFTAQPHIDINGTLSFTLLDGFSGLVHVNVTLIDDGGTERGGINVSVVRNFTVVVSESYLSVVVNGSTDAGGVRSGIASDLGVERRMVLAASATEFVVVATRLAETLRAARRAFNLTSSEAATVWHPASGSRVVSSQGFLRNYGNVANFTVVNRTVLVSGLAYPGGHPLVEAGFIADMVAPEHTPVGLDGRHVVEFAVVPRRFKAYLEAPTWVSDGSGGGVIGSGPNVTSVCEPACTRGVLSLGQSEGGLNGYVEYEVRMLRSNRSEIFYVDAQLVFVPDEVRFVEDQENTSAACFLRFKYAGMTLSLDPPPSVFMQLSAFSLSSMSVQPFSQSSASALLAALPTLVLNTSGCVGLVSELLPDAFGSILFAISATQSLIHSTITTQRSFTFTVMAVNDAPYFTFKCADDAFIVECNNCSDTAESTECEVKVTVNRMNTPTEVSVSNLATYCQEMYMVDNFSQNISASMLALANERNQNLTFVVTVLAEFNATSLFVDGMFPSIDARTGSLSFCVALDQDGNATFEVSLQDDGGQELGGVDKYGAFPLTIVVQPVNQQPSFQLCCGSELHVWLNSGEFLQTTFITNTMSGNMHRDGYEIEHSQLVTFVVLNSLPSAFIAQPHIDINGTLSFTLLDGFSGLVHVNVTLIDDGGTERGGINVSVVRNFTVVVSESYLSVVVNGSTDAGGVRSGIASDLGVERRMVLAASATEFVVVATRLAETLQAARRAFNLTSSEAATVWHPASGSRVVSSQGFLRNYGNVANFTVVNRTVLVSGLAYPGGHPLVEAGFIADMVAPEHTPVGLDGRHVVEFAVVPRRFKAYLEAPTWVSDGSGGGVIGSGPNVTSVCEPACTRGVLSLGQSEGGLNGYVEYEVRMLRSNRSEIFYVDAQLLFVVDTSIQILEDEDNSTLHCFVQAFFAGGLGNASTVLATMESRPLLPGNASVLMSGPLFLFRSTGCWDVFLPLMIHRNGNESFIISSTSIDGRHAFEFGLSVEVIPVNDAPSFDIPSDVVVPENLLEDVQYSVTTAITEVSAGPEDEIWQKLTFMLTFVSGDAALFSSAPYLAADGTVNFTVAQFERGTANYQVVLVDDGGSELGGWNMSMDQTLTIEVLPANHPPVFSLPLNATTFLEQDIPVTLAQPNFATNISPGLQGSTTDPNESSQLLTFHVHQTGGNPSLFFVPPEISDNGTLLVVLTPNQYGFANMVTELQDDGETLGEGIDRSVALNFTIAVEPVNDAPHFIISNSVVAAFELEQANAQTLQQVAANISAGPFEPEQAVTFLVFVHSFRVPDRATQAWSSDLSALYGLNVSGTGNQLFMPGSDITMSNNGSLAFYPAALRNGIVNLSCVAVDDGGIERGGRNMSDEVFFSLRVSPVNSQPTFQLPDPYVVMLEDGYVEWHGFATDIRHGGWDEQDQLLHFTLELDSGPAMLFETLQIECPETGASSCSDGNATLSIELLPHHFGSVRLNVSLRDSGGTEFLGVDSYTLQMWVSVSAVNDFPTFHIGSQVSPSVVPVLTVAEDSGCFTLQNTTAIWPEYLARPSQYECEESEPLHWSFSRFALIDSLGPLEDGPILCPAQTECEDQSPVFTVACEPGWVRLLANLPNVTQDGALFMQLLPQVSGEIGCWVRLEDRASLDGTILSSRNHNFSINVVPVNDQPSFTAGELVNVCEDSGPASFHLALNITRDGGGGTEPNQNLTFSTFFSDSEGLFTENGSPTLSIDGILTFETAKDRFGEVLLFVQLTDDGGTDLGGQDGSIVQQVPITVQPVNDPPAFATNDLTLVEDRGFISQRVAVNATVGAFNEGCEVATVFCQDQKYTYRILDVSESDMFFGFPRIDAAGIMTLELAPDSAGIAVFTVQLVDDGGTNNTCESDSGVNGTARAPSGTDSSAVHTFAVTVEPTNDRPDFRLQWNVTCLTENASCSCKAGAISPACVSVLEGQDSEAALPTPLVTILNTITGNLIVEDFATYITPAEGYLPETQFEYNKELRRTTFAHTASTPVLSRVGLEYATDYVISPDRRHLYAVEADRDSMLTMLWSDDDGAVPTFVDRNSDKEDRLRFLPFPTETAPRNVEGTRAVCGLDAFEHQGSTLVVAASGCDTQLERHLPRPGGVCGDAGGKACGPDCCASLLSDTVGLWTLNTQSTRGGMEANEMGGVEEIACSEEACVYSRPKNSQACAEEFPVRVTPAAFRDDVGELGSAIVMPPACKAGSSIDWDRAESTFSTESFIVNDGQEEAAQFDGALNSGLIISKNIASLVDGTVENSKLPLEELSVEVWFRVNKDTVERAGLVAAQQDGFQCGKGWSLTYSMVSAGPGGYSSTTFSLAASLEGNNFFEYGTLITVSHTIFPALRVGQWAHLVGTYDKTRLSLYVNGQLGQALVACLFPPCGKIVYPAPYHPAGSCNSEGTVFAIGTYVNVRTLQSFPHVGAIRKVRIMKRALLANETAALYEDEKDAVLETTEPDGDYWTKAVGGGERWSPSQDVSSAGTRESVQMRGRFFRGSSYRFRVTSFQDSMLSAACSVSLQPPRPDGPAGPQYGNLLTCSTPEWIYGFRAATIALERNVSSAEDGERWQRLVQKLCLFPDCGFLPWETRTESDWWSSGYRTMIRGGLSGSLTLYRFTTETSLLRFNQQTETLESVSVFSAVTNCSGRVCMFGHGECTGLGAGAGVPCRSDTDCQGQTCRPLSNFAMLGAASVTAFTVHSTRYLLAANFWDGVNTRTFSSLFRLDSMDSVHFLQQIETNGARRWEILHVGNATFAVVANLVGPSFLFPWSSDFDTEPLNVLRRVALNVEGAAGLATFSMGSSTFLAMAVFSSVELETGPSHPSKVLQLDFVQSSDQLRDDVEIIAVVEGGTVVSRAYSLDTGPVLAVEHMVLGSATYLAFAAADGPSPVYRIDPSGQDLHFLRIQAIETDHATSLRHFFNRAHFLVVTQLSADSVMYRWNGTQFFREPNQRTLPKDSAGGQVLLYRSIEAATTFKVAASGGGIEEYMVLGSFGEAGKAVTPSLLLRATQFVVNSFVNPVSIKMTDDGRHVYVAVAGARGILGFERDNRTGLLQMDPAAGYLSNWTSTLVAGGVPTPFGEDRHATGFPLRGIAQISFSRDQQNVYAASMQDNTVAVFRREPQSGELVLLQTLEYQRSFQFSGLDGARGVSESPNGETVYVAGWRDQAVSMWRRAGDGTLTFLDKLRNGERLPHTFRQTIGDAPVREPGETARDLPSGLPFRVGGDAAMSVTAAVHAKIQGRHYWILAQTVVEPERGLGRVAMYAWEPHSSSTALLDFTTADPAPCCLAHFADDDADGVGADFLVVANAATVMHPDARVNVYRWESDGSAFVWQHALPLPPDSLSVNLYASALRPFKIDGRRFLAVSNLRDNNGFFVPSIVYEFKGRAPARTDAGVADPWKRGEFEVFQLFPTQKGVDIEIAETQGRLLLFLAHGPVVGASAQPGRVDVYAFESASDTFQLAQSISSPGINDIEPLQLPGLGLFLALANRQALPLEPDEAGDMTVYDLPSLLLRFDEDTMQFAHWQTLGESFRSVVQNGATPSEQTRFCGDGCALSDDGATRSVSGLRGATRFTAFVSGGETYLAVAQSACSLERGVGQCEWPQPQSAVLQWNRAARSFGELLALTDRESLRLHGRLVPDHDMALHAFALRIDAGAAVGWVFLEVEGRQLLLQASRTRGAVLREWEFRQVGGMQGPASAAADEDDSVVFVASNVGGAVAVLQRQTIFDHVGASKQACADAGCLEFMTALSDTPLLLGAWDVSQTGQVRGLSGAREVLTWETMCKAGACTKVAVRGRLPRDELRCGLVPPVGVASAPDRARAACQDLQFALEVVETSTPLLFVGGTPPRISPTGTLEVGVARGRVGHATYNVRILDSSGAAGRLVSKVHFEVRGFNQAPFFSSFDIITNERTLGPDGADMTFAAGVSAGLNEEYQELTWAYTMEATPGMFGADSPTVRVVGRNASGSSSRDGVLTFPPFATLRPGAASFNLTLVDDGASNAASGDINTSPAGSFQILIRAVNQQPRFDLRSNNIVLEEGRQYILPAFAANMATGDESRAEQTYAFSLGSVLASPGSINGDSAALFVDFRIDLQGTLALSTAPGWSGFFNIMVPRFTSPKLLPLVEAASSAEQGKHFPGFFEILSPDLTLNPDLLLRFRVVDIIVTARDLFVELPAATADGNLSFVLALGQSGVAEVKLLLEVQGNLSSNVPSTSPVATLTISVDALNVAPFFIMMPALQLVQSDAPIRIPAFATNITSGRPSERDQQLSFEISFAAPPHFFQLPPTLSLDGTLSLSLHPDALLTATIYVTLRDDGGVAYGGADKGFRMGTIQVLERPVLSSVFPALLAIGGGTALTLTGKFRGTRGTPSSISVSVGSELCTHVRQVSATELQCRAPPGMGRQRVAVTLTEDAQLIEGAWSGAVLYAQLVVGGAAPDGGSGFVGAGPARLAAGQLNAPGAALADTGLRISRGVSSLAWVGGMLYAGGAFEAAGGARVGYVMSWDSARVARLGRGLDGGVEGMCAFEGKLVVVGSFSRALNAGGGVVNSGGLAVWDGATGRWESLGGRLRGMASAVACGEGGVVVGGKMERADESKVNGLARFDAVTRRHQPPPVHQHLQQHSVAVLAGKSRPGTDTADDAATRWSAVASQESGVDGVKGGEVFALIQRGADLFIGGSFTSAGGARARNAAVFRGGVFEALGDFNGDVRCFAASGDTVFVGGDFTSIDGRSFDRIAVLRGARFESLGQGVSAGSVQSLLFTRGCLYAGGGFAGFAARWCRQPGQVDTQPASGWVRETMEGFTGFGPVRAFAVVFE